MSELRTESMMIDDLFAAIEWAETNHPLPRCIHGNALQDGGGDKLLPSCGCGGEHTSEFVDEHVPIELFGKDHWSTLAYIETRIVDHREFCIIGDPRMRTCHRCWRIANSAPKSMRHADIVKISEYPTRLSDGRLADRHCDWDCLQDLIDAGILATRGEPDLGKKVKITKAGYVVVGALRKHKAEGKSFATFIPPLEWSAQK